MGRIKLYECDACQKRSNGDEATWWVARDYGDRVILHALSRAPRPPEGESDTPRVATLCGMECALHHVSAWMAARSRGGGSARLSVISEPLPEAGVDAEKAGTNEEVVR